MYMSDIRNKLFKEICSIERDINIEDVYTTIEEVNTVIENERINKDKHLHSSEIISKIMKIVPIYSHLKRKSLIQQDNPLIVSPRNSLFLNPVLNVIEDVIPQSKPAIEIIKALEPLIIPVIEEIEPTIMSLEQQLEARIKRNCRAIQPIKIVDSSPTTLNRKRLENTGRKKRV